jgi:hypothetical protein
MTQPINRSLLGFETQIKKLSRSFDTQITKLELPVLRAKPGNPSHRFWGQTEKTVATGFEAKPEKTARVVLMSNHSQTVDLSFETQPRNLHSSSPRARCRPYTASPDILIVRPLSMWPVRPSAVLCTRSPTPATILAAARHAVPNTCTPRDKKTWFSKRNRDKGKTQNFLDSNSNLASQWLITIKSRNWSLCFSISPLMSPLTIKTQSLKFKSKTLWSTARRKKTNKS